MFDQALIPPADNEIEISLFGPGIGEALALHVGNGYWILIDSCLDSSNREPVQLNYLNQIGVDVNTAVKIIVATHWHNDHIRGLSTLLSRCQNAEFVTSRIITTQEFLTIISLYRRANDPYETNFDEFAKIFHLLEQRKAVGARLLNYKFAAQNTRLFSSAIITPVTNQTIPVNLYSLSPSNNSEQQAILALSNLIPTESSQKTFVAQPSPNDSSIVVWLEVGNCSILLGADLETTSDPGTGWAAVVRNNNVCTGKASVFKIPHHGSENGFSEEVWENLLIKSPYAMLSPYNGGKKPLPTNSDIARIKTKTNKGLAHV